MTQPQVHQRKLPTMPAQPFQPGPIARALGNISTEDLVALAGATFIAGSIQVELQARRKREEIRQGQL